MNLGNGIPRKQFGRASYFLATFVFPTLDISVTKLEARIPFSSLKLSVIFAVK